MEQQSAGWIREARIASWWLNKNDFYWPDYEVAEEIKRRAAYFAANGVNVVVIFGLHFRWDYVPYFERLRALFRCIIEECHKHGIRVCDHYSDTLIHRPRNEADRWFIRERLNHHVAIYPDFDRDYEYEGTWRNAWRMVDIRTNAPVYFEKYRCHIFCPNNPDFQRASASYAVRQFAEVGIDGLMNDDLHFLPDYHVCACKYCRARFKREYGHNLPPAADNNFWGNRENPAFRDWLAMRLRSMGDHYVRLRKALGSGKPLFGCCSETASQAVSDVGLAYDEFIRGCNVSFMEICGTNPVTAWRHTCGLQAIHQAIAAGGDYFRGKVRHILGVTQADPCLAIIYAEFPDQFFMCWALEAACGLRSWVCRRTNARDAQRARIVYDDESHLGKTLKWEAAHKDFYHNVKRIADVGVVFSTATRNFASPEEAKKHRSEYIFWMQLLFDYAVLSEAVLTPALRGANAGGRLANKYALLILPQIAALDETEMEGLAGFLKAGGNLLVSGVLGTRTASGARRDTALLSRLAEQSKKASGQMIHWPGMPVEPAEKAMPDCRDMIERLVPERTLLIAHKASGWSFHLYKRGNIFFLHCLNLSGTVAVDGKKIPEDKHLRFPVPPSGVIECRLRLSGTGDYRAALFSPDGAEGTPVKLDRQGDILSLKIPARQARRYGVVMIKEK
ncbi:MAG: hypothetical protein PHW60_09395 [Kiritimatiellae bacterium]|nr:hypothetical protein [Kiritimatiellia bacterium]